MESGYQISKKPDFLYVQTSGTGSSSSTQDFFQQVPEAAHAADIKKVLVDARAAEGVLDTMDRYELGAMLAEQFRGLQVAFVVNETLIDPELFGQTVAVNRGANERVFTSLEDAQSWLKIDPADKPDQCNI